MAGNGPQTERMACPGCQGSIEIRGLGQTCTIGCPYCGSVFDLGDSDYKLIKVLDKLPYKPIIELGRKAKFPEGIFQIVGFLVRSDGSGMYEWEEYLLFSPYKGFRWLVQNMGHWSYITPIKPGPKRDLYRVSNPVGGGFGLDYQNTTYKLFLKGQAKVRFVMGEFYWQVRLGDSVAVEDYIAPPYMLSNEYDKKEFFWSHGEYLPRKVVHEIFPNLPYLPHQMGIAPNQPIMPGFDFKLATATFIFTFICMFIFQVISAMRADDRMIFKRDYQPGISAPDQILNTGNIQHLKDGNILIKVNAPTLDNSWIDLDYSLINIADGESLDANLEIGYYQGYDSDGRWTEGSKYGQVFIPSVPAGNYNLAITPTSSDIGKYPYFDLEIRENVAYWGNFTIALCITAIPLLILAIYKYLQESKRWQESDF